MILETTERVSDQVEAILENEAGVTNYTTAIGGGIPKFFTAMNVYNKLPQNAQIMFRVDLEETKYKKIHLMQNICKKKWINRFSVERRQ